MIEKLRNHIYNRISTLGVSISALCQERKNDELASDGIALRAMEIENLIELLDILRDYETCKENHS